MLYHRFCGLEPAGHLVAFEGAPGTRNTVPSDAKTLRARAAHCRALAGTFYDQSIVSELEMFARELDAEAAALERRDARAPQQPLAPRKGEKNE